MNTSGRPPDSLLSDSERELLVALLFSGCTPEEIDRKARDLLLARDAMTAWEARLRDAGATRFTLGNHRVFEFVCKGETYVVVRGQNLFTGTLDVLKAIYNGNNRVQRRARHLQKLRAQSMIRSSRFAAFYDAGRLAADIAVTEHVPGGDLRTVVRRRGPLRMAAAATISSQIALGIAELHALGLAYTNLQSNKILFERETATKLCDAGQGHPLGTVLGLPPPSGRAWDYVSPEILTSGEVTPASDVYSLGCVLYYAVTGKVAFPGGTENDKRGGHLYRFPLDPRRLADGLDDAFVDLIAKMMTKTPSERIQSMAEVATRLEPWAKVGGQLDCEGGRAS